MSSLTKLLTPDKPPEVQTGEVISVGQGNIYLVRVAEKEFRIRSTVPGQLAVGSRVVLTNTDEGTFIIAQDMLRDRSKNIVTITG